MRELRQRFETEGILILPGFFDRADLAPLAAVLDRFAETAARRPLATSEEYGRRFETKLQVWPAESEPAVRALLRHPRMVEITEVLIGRDFRTQSARAFATPPGCGQGWQQDSGMDEPGQFVLNRILLTRDVEPEQGALFWVPRSHTQGDLPPGGNHDPLPGEASHLPEAGTLVVMHSRLQHRVGINRSRRLRIQLESRAEPAGARADLCNYAVFRTGTWCFSEAGPWSRERPWEPLAGAGEEER